MSGAPDDRAQGEDELDDPRTTVAPSVYERLEAESGASGPGEAAPAGDEPDGDEPDGDAEPADGTVEDVAPREPVAATEASELDDAEAHDDDEEDPLQDVPLETRLEAILFGATGPLSLARLKSLSRCDDGREVREALDLLAREYDAGRRAFVIEELAGGFQLRTRPELAALIEATGRRRESAKLSPAALETLSIVAYRQPVLRADVEAIRGVSSGEMLRSLIEKELVKVTDRADLPGSPLLYGTTTRFLEEFGLRNLRDLPRDRELLRAPE